MIAAGRRSKCSATRSGSFSRVDLGRAEGLDHHRDRVRDADGVRDLHLAAARDAGGDHVLGHVAHRVRGRAVDLGRVLAAERAAAVAGHAAVGVDDDLAAGEAAVGVRPTELERAGRVDQHLEVVVGELLGDRGLDDVLDEVGLHLPVDVDAGRVLAGDQHGRRAASDGRPRRRWSPGSCRRGAGSRGCRPCAPRRAGGRGGARARSASA